MDNNNLVTALSAQIQISVALVGMVRKPWAEPIVLAKRWVITPEKAQKTYKSQCREKFEQCYTLHCQNDSEQMIGIFVNVALHIPYSQTQFLLISV